MFSFPLSSNLLFKMLLVKNHGIIRCIFKAINKPFKYITEINFNLKLTTNVVNVYQIVFNMFKSV